MYARSRFFAATLTLLGLAVSAPALAGGMVMPDNGTRAMARGGAFTALADDLSAIHHNPGALIKVPGSSVLLSNHVFFIDERFTRAETLLIEDPFANAEVYGLSPNEEVRNAETVFPLGPVIAAGSDFGLDHWTFALGVYGPNGSGAAKWPVKGGQRYMLTEMEAILFYLTGSVAYGHRDTFGFGVSLQAAMAPSMRLQMVVDGGPNASATLNPYAAANDVEAKLEVSDLFAFTAIVGAWWRPVESFEIGLSGRVIPVNLDATGDFQLQNVPGQTQFEPERLEVTDSSARLEMQLPPTAQLGLRYRNVVGGEECWDIEFDVVYEAWSLMRSMDVEMNGVINLFGGNNETPDTSIARHWRDTISLRLGSTMRLGSWASLSLGAYYETGAVPPNYEHIDFMSFERAGLSAGLGADIASFRVRTGDGFAADIGKIRLMLAYMHVFQESRAVSEATGKVYQQRPLSPCPDECLIGATGVSGVPVNAGVFTSSYDILSFSAEVTF